MLDFTTANRCAEWTQTTDIETNASTLRSVVGHDLTRGEDRLERIIALDQNARRELLGWRTESGKYRCRHCEHTIRGALIEVLDPAHPILRLCMEGGCGSDDVANLRRLEDKASLGTVLNKVLLDQLVDGSVWEQFVLVVLNELLDVIPLFFRVPLEQLLRVEACLNVANDDRIETRNFILTVHVLAKHADALLAGHVLVVDVASLWVLLLVDQVDHGTKRHVVEFTRGHAITKVRLCLHLDHRWRDVRNALAYLRDLILPFRQVERNLSSRSLDDCVNFVLSHTSIVTCLVVCHNRNRGSPKTMGPSREGSRSKS